MLLLAAGAPPSAAATPCAFTVALTAQPSSGAGPLVVHFTAAVSSGSPTGYNWSFGDGSYWNSSGAGASSPIHRYATIGLFQVQVGVTESGCTVTGLASVAAVAGPLTVLVVAHPLSGHAPLTVIFNATVSGGTGTYASANWSFGDGGLGSGLNVAYTYSRAGSFVARLNVTDSSGHWGLARAEVNVTGGGASSPGLGVLGLLGYIALALAVGAVTALWVYRRVRAGPAPPETIDRGPLPTEGPSGSVGPAAPPVAEARTGRPTSIDPSPALGAPVPAGAAAADDRPAAPNASRSPDRLQLTQRVILHIGAQGRLGRDEVGPWELTQGGMSETLGASQNTVTNVLRRLVAAGVLEQEVRHVRGRPRRLRVYTFTPRGESLYGDLRRSLADRRNARETPERSST